jgi:hypothetical protein
VPFELALPLRDEAADEGRLEALALLGLLRADEDLLLEPLRLLLLVDPLRLFLFEDALRLPREALWFFGLDPFELRDVVFRLSDERVLAWAIAPP